jgi:hypothetical protein
MDKGFAGVLAVKLKGTIETPPVPEPPPVLAYGSWPGTVAKLAFATGDTSVKIVALRLKVRSTN